MVLYRCDADKLDFCSKDDTSCSGAENHNKYSKGTVNNITKALLCISFAHVESVNNVHRI